MQSTMSAVKDQIQHDAEDREIPRKSHKVKLCVFELLSYPFRHEALTDAQSESTTNVLQPFFVI